jgi:hypothetical protein
LIAILPHAATIRIYGTGAERRLACRVGHDQEVEPKKSRSAVDAMGHQLRGNNLCEKIK